MIKVITFGWPFATCPVKLAYQIDLILISAWKVNFYMSNIEENHQH